MQSLNPIYSIAIYACIFLLSCGGGSTEKESKDTVDNLSNSDTKGRIVFLGDSLTSGFTLNPANAYPALIQQRIDSLGLPYLAENDGVSGDTSEDGVNRLEPLLRQPISVLVLALGVNDAEDRLPVTQVQGNLQRIIDRVKAANPTSKLLVSGVKLPALMSAAQISDYAAMYQQLAVQNQAALLPNFLQGVAGNPKLNLADTIHPNAAGHQIVAQTVWTELEPLLK